MIIEDKNGYCMRENKETKARFGKGYGKATQEK